MRILNPRIPKEKKAEIISAYLTGDNSYASQRVRPSVSILKRVTVPLQA